MTAEQICEAGGVKREVRCLDLIGVREPLSVVLEHGPERCRQVREWVKKLKQREGVTNEAGPVAPQRPRGAVRQRCVPRPLTEHGMDCSMSRKDDCYDNAVMESFFGTLKTELVHHKQYTTRSQAEASIFEYIEVFYNRQRLHSTEAI